MIASKASEFDILLSHPLEEFENPVLKEALRRLRAGNVIKKAGFDGEFGVIRLFDDLMMGRDQ